MPLQKTQSNFCIKPFTSVDLTTDGRIRACCEIRPNASKFVGKKKFNVKDSMKNYWDSDYRKYLMQKFLDNKKPVECKNCWIQESKNSISLRQEANKENKVIFKTNFVKHLNQLKKLDLKEPEYVHMSITNLCNLKCQMCEGASSSTLLNENVKLGFEKKIKQKDFDWTQESRLNFVNELLKHDLKSLGLMGGESLMVPEILILLRELSKKQDITENMHLMVITNGTQCNDKILDILGKFKKLKIMLSMESTGKQNEYIRFPSNWQVIKENIAKFKTLPHATLYINCVVQNLNILYLDQLIDFAYEQDIHLKFEILQTPTYLQFKNLPIALLTKSYNKLKNVPKEKIVHTTNFDNLLNLMGRQIEQKQKPSSSEYAEFKTMIKTRDQYRKISIKNYMPEIAQEI